jgi:hypothetical protein
LEHDVAQIILDPLQAIKGPKYEDTEANRQDQIKYKPFWHSKWEKEMSDFPEEYWEAFSVLPNPTTTTFRPFIEELYKTELGYLTNNSN